MNALQAKTNVSAAQMIYDVAQACEINPQVLLVMLQKETSLITMSAPEDWRYQRAMGYACPDGAPCDTAYYGLLIQLYSAASQLNYYSTPGSIFTWYPIGSVTAVRYHLNAACGSEEVRIQNRATAALYYLHALPAKLCRPRQPSRHGRLLQFVRQPELLGLLQRLVRIEH